MLKSGIRFQRFRQWSRSRRMFNQHSGSTLMNVLWNQPGYVRFSDPDIAVNQWKKMHPPHGEARKILLLRLLSNWCSRLLHMTKLGGHSVHCILWVVWSLHVARQLVCWSHWSLSSQWTTGGFCRLLLRSERKIFTCIVSSKKQTTFVALKQLSSSLSVVSLFKSKFELTIQRCI